MKKSFGSLFVLSVIVALGVLFQPGFADAEIFDSRIKNPAFPSIPPVPAVPEFITDPRFTASDGDFCLSPVYPGKQTALQALQAIYPSKDADYIQERIDKDGDSDPVGLVTCGRSCDDPTTIINEAKTCEICDLIALPKGIAVTLVFVWMPILLGIIIVFAGLLLMTSAGNPQKRSKAIAMIKWAIIGYVIMLSAWIVINGALSLLGVQEGFSDWWNTDCG